MFNNPQVTLELHHMRAAELHATAARARRVRQARQRPPVARDDGGRTAEGWWSRFRAPAVS
jgi:hypothetical protein